MNSQATTPNTEASILARIIRADEDPLSPDVARYLLSMRLPASDEERLNELSAKAQAGSMTEAETQELDSYLHIGFLLGVLQAKARGLLKEEQGLRQH
jgi:hypothetical protein